MCDCDVWHIWLCSAWNGTADCILGWPWRSGLTWSYSTLSLAPLTRPGRSLLSLVILETQVGDHWLWLKLFIWWVTTSRSVTTLAKSNKINFYLFCAETIRIMIQQKIWFHAKFTSNYAISFHDMPRYCASHQVHKHKCQLWRKARLTHNQSGQMQALSGKQKQILWGQKY